MRTGTVRVSTFPLIIPILFPLEDAGNLGPEQKVLGEKGNLKVQCFLITLAFYFTTHGIMSVRITYDVGVGNFHGWVTQQ